MEHELDDRPYERDKIQLERIQKVTAADVLAVAQKYLDPEKLTIAVFGTLTPEDEEALNAWIGVTKLDEDEGFKGGYWGRT